MASFGCGSVGSKLALHLVRAGAGPTHVVDRSQMSPHNYARHGLVPISPVDAGTLCPKSDLLAEEISRFGQDCTPVRADIATKLMTDKGLLAITGLAVNATGSLTVRESLCRQGLVRPQIAECCLTAAGRIGYMAIEGGSLKRSISDIVTEAYRLMASDEEFGVGLRCAAFRNRHRRRVFLAHVPDDRRPSLRLDRADGGASAALVEPEPSSTGELLIGATPEDGLGQRWTRRDIPAFREVTVKQYRIRISARVHDMIEREVASKPGIETGGVIIGRWSDVTDTFHVVDVLPAPPDSVFSAQEFTLGVEGLKVALDDVIERGGGSLYALGTGTTTW